MYSRARGTSHRLVEVSLALGYIVTNPTVHIQAGVGATIDNSSHARARDKRPPNYSDGLSWVSCVAASLEQSAADNLKAMNGR